MPFGEPLEVPGDLEEVLLGDVRRVHERVAGFLVALARVVLHELAHEPAIGVEHRQPRADLVREREQVELGAEPAVVALARLLETVHVRIELVPREPRRAVHALQLLVARVAAPVHAGDAEHADSREPPGVRHVRAAAQVDELAGPVDADRGDIVGQPVDDVHLEVLVHGGEHLDRLRARHLLLHERDLPAGELVHARLDAAGGRRPRSACPPGRRKL